MKILFLCLLLGVICSAFANAFSNHLSESDIHKSLAKIASLTLLQGFKDKAQTDLYNQESETRATLLPPFPDPVIIDDFQESFPEDSEFGEIFFGNISVWDASVTGLSSILDNFELKWTVPAGVVYSLQSETISLHGNHDISVNVSQLYLVSGQTNFELKAVDFFFDLDVKLLINLITNRLSVSAFSIDFGFKELGITFGDTVINDEPLEWDIITKNVNCIIQVYWPVLREIFNPLIKDELNALIKDCKLTDLIDGNYSCLGIEAATQSQLDLEFNRLLPNLEGCQASQIMSGDWQCIQHVQLDKVTKSLIEGVQAFETLDFECPNAETGAPGTTENVTTESAGTTENVTTESAGTTENVTTESAGTAENVYTESDGTTENVSTENTTPINSGKVASVSLLLVLITSMYFLLAWY